MSESLVKAARFPDMSYGCENLDTLCRHALVAAKERDVEVLFALIGAPGSGKSWMLKQAEGFFKRRGFSPHVVTWEQATVMSKINPEFGRMVDFQNPLQRSMTNGNLRRLVFDSVERNRVTLLETPASTKDRLELDGKPGEWIGTDRGGTGVVFDLAKNQRGAQRLPKFEFFAGAIVGGPGVRELRRLYRDQTRTWTTSIRELLHSRPPRSPEEKSRREKNEGRLLRTAQSIARIFNQRIPRTLEELEQMARSASPVAVRVFENDLDYVTACLYGADQLALPYSAESILEMVKVLTSSGRVPEKPQKVMRILLEKNKKFRDRAVSATYQHLLERTCGLDNDHATIVYNNPDLWDVMVADDSINQDRSHQRQGSPKLLFYHIPKTSD